MKDRQPDFNEIHREFRPRVLRYLARMVGEAQAEDLTQEVFAKVAHALKAFRGESTWIYRIATNTDLDKMKNYFSVGWSAEEGSPLKRSRRCEMATWPVRMEGILR